MKQLGAAVGAAESTISHYETGKRQLDNETLIKLSKFFNVTTDYILGVEKSAPAVAGKHAFGENMNLSQTELDLLHKFRQLDERGRSAVLHILDHEYTSITGEETTSHPRQA